MFASQFAFAQIALPVFWDFSNPAISSAPSGWSISLGSSSSYNYAFGCGDNVSCKFDNSGEYIQVFFNASPSKIAYYMSPQNSGSPWGGQFDVLESANGINWTNVHSYTYKATTSSTYTNCKFTDNLLSNTRYVKFVFTTKQTGGSGVAGGNVGIDSVYISPSTGGTTSNGGSFQCKYAGVSRNMDDWLNMPSNDSIYLTLQNAGSSDTLKIDSFSAISGYIYQNNAFAYSLSLPIKINPTDSTKILIRRINTGINGDKAIRLKIHSSDINHNYFFIRLKAIEGPLSTEPSKSPEYVLLKDTTSYSFIIQSKHSLPEAIDSLPARLITLIKDSPISDVPIDGQTYMRGMNIGSSKVLATDSGTFKTMYIIANKTYYLKTFTYRGNSGSENYNTGNSLTDSITTYGSLPGNYYSGIDVNNSNFVSTLSSKINYHDTITYANYVANMIYPWLARDTLNGQHVVYCVYTGVPYVYASTFSWWNGTNGGVHSREHTYPQSWMPSNTGTFPTGSNGKELPEYNDMHHLFPADQVNANGVRSNYPFGEVVTVTKLSPNGVGKLGKDVNGNTVYEPIASHKGDAVRALMYMAVCYNGVGGRNWSFAANQDTTIVMKWHRQDPPDAHEIARNEYIYSVQHNRNPFIDHPDWADRVNFKTISYINKPVCNTPQNIRVIPLSNTSLKIQWDSVSTASNYTLYYRFQGNNTYQVLNGSTALNQLSMSGLNEAKNYEIQVQTTCPSLSSVASNIQVVSTPGVLSIQADTIRCVNDSFKLQVQMNGNYTYTYQWQKNHSNISGATQSSYMKTSFSAADTGTYQLLATYQSNTFYSAEVKVKLSNTCSSGIQVNIKVYPEAYYDGGKLRSLLNQIDPTISSKWSDTVYLQLYDTLSHQKLIQLAICQDTSGAAVFSIPNSLLGKYAFVSVKQKNSIETFAANKVLLNANLNFNFTGQSNMVFGQNVRSIDIGKYGMYSGDVNQDGIVNNDDVVLLDNANNQMLSGYLNEDLNGDGIVSNDDVVIIDNNNSNFISVQYPW